jgi:hypothetical protein
MSHRIVEKRPREGSIFLVKYTFDNRIWHQFFSSHAQESGGMYTFFGCRAKLTSLDAVGGPILKAGRLPDVQLDGSRTRILALIVRRPAWFDDYQEESGESPDFALSSLKLPGLSDYR